MRTNRRLLNARHLAALCGVVCWTMMALVPKASGAGLLIADGGFGGQLAIKEHDVKVTINNGIAVTQVTQVFQNKERRQVEALYTFPVPKGASVSGFSMWINGKEMLGEVLEKKRAREIYESYKQTRRDPGLVEQVDYRTFEMRIFPIGPQAEQKVQLTYYQELDYDHDWGTYVYPLATTSRKDLTAQSSGKFAINVDVKSAIPISSLESPSHSGEMVVVLHGDQYGQASLETTDGSLARDLVLAHRLSRPRTGLDLVASKNKGEKGFFCLSITAGDDLAKRETGMDYLFVLDISGSMANDGKLRVSKESIGAFLKVLDSQDRMEVMTFNVKAATSFGKLQLASEETKAAALQFLGTQEARGGTLLTPAMNLAYKYADADRPLHVVIFSDGLTEQSERQELLRLIQSRPRNARVFCIGVGNDINRPLLEQLAEDSGGLAAFVSAGDNFDRQAAAFRRKLMRPVASDLSIDVAGVQVSELEPEKLSNLYHGTPLRLYGTYAKGGEAQVTVRGSINGLEFKQAATLVFPEAEDANPEIDRIWAWRRIDGLLKQADRTGSREAVIPEVVSLGEGFSIVTEYTSFLVLENDAEYQRWKIGRNNLARQTRDRKAQEQLRAQLNAIRDKAMAGLGPSPDLSRPNPSTPAKQLAAANQPRPAQRPQTLPPASPSPSRRSFDLGLGGGSGPVGPLFTVLALWLASRKRKQD